MILTAEEIGDVLSGKMTEKRFHIEEPPEWGKDDIVRLKRKGSRGYTSHYVKITDWDIVTVHGEDGMREEYALWFQRCAGPHESRLLTYAGRPKGSEKGYTHLPGYAMKGEPEALSEEEQSDISRAQREKWYYHQLKRCAENKVIRSEWPFEVRIERAIAAAKANNVDIRSNVRTAKKLRSLGKPQSVIEQHMRILERRAYREPK